MISRVQALEVAGELGWNEDRTRQELLRFHSDADAVGLAVAP